MTDRMPTSDQRAQDHETVHMSTGNVGRPAAAGAGVGAMALPEEPTGPGADQGNGAAEELKPQRPQQQAGQQADDRADDDAQNPNSAVTDALHSCCPFRSPCVSLLRCGSRGPSSSRRIPPP